MENAIDDDLRTIDDVPDILKKASPGTVFCIPGGDIEAETEEIMNRLEVENAVKIVRVHTKITKNGYAAIEMFTTAVAACVVYYRTMSWSIFTDLVNFCATISQNFREVVLAANGVFNGAMAVFQIWKNFAHKFSKKSIRAHVKTAEETATEAEEEAKKKEKNEITAEEEEEKDEITKGEEKEKEE